MEDPELYEENNSLQQNIVVDILSKYFHLLKWKESSECIILDVGCGTGNTTYDILLPKLPQNARVYGSDIICNMVSYAALKYPKLRFFVQDIADENMPKYFYKVFDQVFSFFCLHWVPEERTAFRNIYNMLKPQGSFFACYVVKCSFIQGVYNISKNMKWKKYIPNTQERLSRTKYQDESVARKEEIIKQNLVDAGFSVSVCEIFETQFKFLNMEVYKKAQTAINPYIKYIPEYLKEEFIDDLFIECCKLKFVPGNNDNTKFVTEALEMVVIVATKL